MKISLLALLLIVTFFAYAPSASALECGGQTCLMPNAVCCSEPGDSQNQFCSTASACQEIQNASSAQGQANTPTTNSTNQNSGGGSTQGGGLTNPLKVDSLEGLLALILQAIVSLGTIVLVIMLVYVGFLFVVAQGNEEKLKNAKSALLWTVIGGLVLLGAQSISLVIQSTVESLR